jgi:hypothetical protein
VRLDEGLRAGPCDSVDEGDAESVARAESSPGESRARAVLVPADDADPVPRNSVDAGVRQADSAYAGDPAADGAGVRLPGVVHSLDPGRSDRIRQADSLDAVRDRRVHADSQVPACERVPGVVVDPPGGAQVLSEPQDSNVRALSPDARRSAAPQDREREPDPSKYSRGVRGCVDGIAAHANRAVVVVKVRPGDCPAAVVRNDSQGKARSRLPREVAVRIDDHVRSRYAGRDRDAGPADGGAERHDGGVRNGHSRGGVVERRGTGEGGSVRVGRQEASPVGLGHGHVQRDGLCRDRDVADAGQDVVSRLTRRELAAGKGRPVAACVDEPARLQPDERNRQGDVRLGRDAPGNSRRGPVPERNVDSTGHRAGEHAEQRDETEPHREG